MWNREQKVPSQVPFLGVRRQTTCASNSTWVIYPRMVRPRAYPNSQSLSGRVFSMVSHPSIAGLLLISLCSLGATAYPPENPIAHQQGSWQVVSFTRNETVTPKVITDSIVRIVEKDHVIWKREGKAFAGTKVEWDTTKTPMWIDVLPDGGPSKGEKIPGIYKVDGNLLTICMADKGKARPTQFASPKGSDHTLMVFRKSPIPPKNP